MKERKVSIACEALNSYSPFCTSVSSHSFSQPSLIFLILAQAVMPTCSVLLSSKFQPWDMQKNFLRIPWDYQES